MKLLMAQLFFRILTKPYKIAVVKAFISVPYLAAQFTKDNQESVICYPNPPGFLLDILVQFSWKPNLRIY